MDDMVRLAVSRREDGLFSLVGDSFHIDRRDDRGRSRRRNEMKLSVVIPVYDEANTIMRVLRRVSESAPENMDMETIVVDDGSSDGTAELLRSLSGKPESDPARTEDFVLSAEISAGRIKIFFSDRKYG